MTATSSPDAQADDAAPRPRRRDYALLAAAVLVAGPLARWTMEDWPGGPRWSRPSANIASAVLLLGVFLAWIHLAKRRTARWLARRAAARHGSPPPAA